MKPIPKYYLKSFLFIALWLAVVIPFVDYLFGDSFRPIKNLISIVGISFFITIITVPEKLKKIRKLGFTDITDELLSNHQIREFETQLSIDEIKTIIENDDKSKKLNKEIHGNSIILSIKRTLFSWEDIINIKLIQQDNEQNI